MSSTCPAAVIVLAAGEGTRMRSATPKVLHRLAGRTLVGHAVRTARALQPDRLLVVVGHGRDAVAAHLAEIEPTAQPVVQEEQRGTGHAVRTALAALPDPAGPVLVITADTPLLTAETLARLVDTHVQGGHAATVLSAVVPDPTGYGRIIRTAGGDAVTGIVEHRDADQAQRGIAEINSGVFVFDGKLLGAALQGLTADNAAGEEYLTDVIGILHADGHPLGAVVAPDHREVLGVNDRVQLAEAGRIYHDRVLTAWMRAGVTCVDPATTWIDADVRLERDVVLHPGTRLHGGTSVGEGAEIGPDCTLTDTAVGAGARVRNAVCDSAEIGEQATVGPYAYLRPGAVLGRRAKVGTYVEVKGSRLGEGTKVPHLTYVGDATIGDHTNIGAATVFVNYDGVNKHHTVIGSHARTGADNMFVAPVTVGDGAYTAAGSVITDDVPPGAMAVARARQRNIEGWVQRRRAGTDAARAASAATGANGIVTPEDGDGG